MLQNIVRVIERDEVGVAGEDAGEQQRNVGVEAGGADYFVVVRPFVLLYVRLFPVPVVVHH